MSAGPRSIADFFEAPLSAVRAAEPVPCAIHLYFSLNQHLLLWIRPGDVPAREFLRKYVDRGLTKVWIQSSDRAAWEEYLKPKPKAPPAPRPRTAEGALLAAVAKSPTMTPEQKQAVVAEVAQETLREMVHAPTPAAQAAAEKKAWETIQDLLDATADNVADAVADIWRLAKVDADLEHAVNVATYAVIFAMAFGKIESDLVADLALAGLLHDLGLSQVPAELCKVPWKKMTPAELQAYSAHVGGGLDIVARHATAVPERVRLIIHQHHEKFDGTGYPQRLAGFRLDDIAQLLGMADVLNAISTGLWDGTERSLKDTFVLLEQLEKARTFPEHFNPDLFTAVLQWIRSKPASDVAANATQVVGKRTQELISGKAGA
jgi:HD-GYP domain-containing protein (c-di-GMP phosphodiesterase class II)